MVISVASRNMITELHVHCGTAPGDSDTEQAGRMGRHAAAEGDKTLKANLHDKKSSNICTFFFQDLMQARERFMEFGRTKDDCIELHTKRRFVKFDDKTDWEPVFERDRSLLQVIVT